MHRIVVVDHDEALSGLSQQALKTVPECRDADLHFASSFEQAQEILTDERLDLLVTPWGREGQFRVCIEQALSKTPPPKVIVYDATVGTREDVDWLEKNGVELVCKQNQDMIGQFREIMREAMVELNLPPEVLVVDKSSIVHLAEEVGKEVPRLSRRVRYTDQIDEARALLRQRHVRVLITAWGTNGCYQPVVEEALRDGKAPQVVIYTHSAEHARERGEQEGWLSRVMIIPKGESVLHDLERLFKRFILNTL